MEKRLAEVLIPSIYELVLYGLKRDRAGKGKVLPALPIIQPDGIIDICAPAFDFNGYFWSGISLAKSCT